MPFQEDCNDQMFVQVANIRATILHYTGDKDWAGTGRYLGFRALQENGRLMMGPAMPIGSDLPDGVILQMIAMQLGMINAEPAKLGEALAVLKAA